MDMCYISTVQQDENTNQYLCFDGLVQDYSNSIANALEVLRSCTKPSIYSTQFVRYTIGNEHTDIPGNIEHIWAIFEIKINRTKRLRLCPLS